VHDGVSLSENAALCLTCINMRTKDSNATESGPLAARAIFVEGEVVLEPRRRARIVGLEPAVETLILVHVALPEGSGVPAFLPDVHQLLVAPVARLGGNTMEVSASQGRLLL